MDGTATTTRLSLEVGVDTAWGIGPEWAWGHREWEVGRSANENPRLMPRWVTTGKTYA